MEENKKPKKVAKWLRALEAQSWQAELLISGLVIAGLIQLPEAMIQYIEGYIIESSELGFMFLTMAALLVVAGIDSLILFFGLHFIFRGIWVALLGLNSVFPEGINTASTVGAGPKYWAKTKEKYPNLSAYNEELDKKCSLIFSLATVVIIMLTSISVIILFIYLLFKMLVSVLPQISAYIIPISIGLYVIFLTTSLGLQFLAKRYPDNPRIEKIIMGYGLAIGSLFSLYIFRKPSNYISGILMSNVRSKWILPMMVGGGFMMGLIGGSHTDKYPAFHYFSASRYFSFNNRPYQFFDFNYEDQLREGATIITPVIPSDVIYGSVLKVFIPTIDREKAYMDIKEFSILERFKIKRKDREVAYEKNLKAFQKFNQVLINDVAYPDLDVQYFRHPQALERGIQLYIPTDNLKKGKNILEIRKDYFSEDGVQKVVKIPFYFGENTE